MAGTKYLLQNATSDGAGSATVLNYTEQKVLLQAFGTWGGATVVVQTIAPDNVTWIALADLTGSAFTMTADTQFTVSDFVFNQQCRAVLSGASGSTNLNVTLQEL